jgi:protein-export membrane protein SecD
LNIVEERTVGPSLGADSIKSGQKAALIGIALVTIFMIGYYKFAGVISVFGILLNTLFLLALLSWLGFTLTLPGIAGIILNVGMAVDANVLIYERIKDELKAGKSIRVAVGNGFDRAFWPIFDSNITTLIAAFVLTQFGTGPIKGFAVTLSIGIVVTLFVALYITKYIYELILINKNLKKLSI